MDAASVDIQRLWRGHQGRKESARQQLIYERTRLKLRKEKSNKAVNNSNSYSNNHSNSGRSSVVDSDSNRNVSGVVEEIGDERVTVFKAVKKKKSGAVSSPSRPFIPVLVPSTAVHDDQSLLQIPHRLNNNNSNSSSNSDGNSDGNNNSYSNNSMENNIRAIMYDNDYEDNRGQLNVIEEEEDEMLRDSLNTTAIKKQISRPHSCFSKSKHSDSHLTDSRNKSTGALSHSHRDSHEIPQNYSSPEDLVTPGNNTDVDEDFYNSDRNKNYSREYDRPNLVELGDMYDDVAAVVDSLDDPLEQFRREDYGQYVSTDEDDFAEMEKKILSENNDHLRTNTKGNASSTVGGRISNNSSHLKRSNSYTYNNNDKVDDLVDERFDELANKLLQSLPRSNLISSRKGSTDLIKYGSVTHSEDSLTDLQGANDCTEQIVEQSALNKKRIDHSNEEEKGFVPVTTNENHRQVKKQQIISPRAVVSNSNINSISPRVGVPQTSAGLQPSSGSSYLEINAKQKQKEQSLLENAKKLYDQNAKRNFPLLKQAQMQAKRNQAAIVIQKTLRGMLGRKAAAKRRKLLAAKRFTCPNCGRIELGGVYCKGCGRKNPRSTSAGRGRSSSANKRNNSAIDGYLNNAPMKITNKNDIRVSNNSKNIAADSPHENRSRVRPIESAVAINQPRPHNKAAVQSNSKENYSNQDSPKKLKSLMNSPPRQSSNQNPQLNQRVRESMSNTRASEEQEMKLLAEIEELNRKQAHIKHDAGNENASLFKKDDVVDQQKGKPVRGVHPSDEARPRAISRGKVSIANGSVDKVGEERSISSMRSKQKPAVERPKMLKVKDEVKEREKLAFKAGAKDMKPQKESRHATPNPQRLVKEWSSALERDKPTNGENNSVISNEPSVDSGKSPVEQLAYQLMAADGGGYLNMFKKKVDVKARSNSRRQQRKYQSDEQSVDSHARSEGNHTNRSGKEDYQETSSLPVLVSPRHLEKARAIQQGENSHPMQSRRVNNRSNKTLSAPSGQQKEMVPNAAQREAANGFPPPVRRSHDYGDQESVPSLIPQRKGKSSIPVRK